MTRGVNPGATRAFPGPVPASYWPDPAGSEPSGAWRGGVNRNERRQPLNTPTRSWPALAVGALGVLLLANPAHAQVTISGSVNVVAPPPPTVTVRANIAPPPVVVAPAVVAPAPRVYVAPPPAVVVAPRVVAPAPRVYVAPPPAVVVAPRVVVAPPPPVVVAPPPRVYVAPPPPVGAVVVVGGGRRHDNGWHGEHEHHDNGRHRGHGRD